MSDTPEYWIVSGPDGIDECRTEAEARAAAEGLLDLLSVVIVGLTFFAIALIGIRPRVLDGVKEERKRWS